MAAPSETPRSSADPTTGSPAGTYLTQDEAAAACAVSRDTIRRYRRNHKLPNSRTRPDGVVEVAVADLVAAGLLDPLATVEVHDVAARTRAERDLNAARSELAVAAARIEALSEQLAQAQEEIVFLRRLVSRAA